MKADSRGISADRLVLDWLIPASFALLVSATIRFHSLAPGPSMPRMVGDLLAIAAIMLVLLMALGRHLAVPRDITRLLIALGAAAAVSVLGSGGTDISLLRLELYLAIALLAIVFYLAHRDTGQIPLASYFLGIGLVHLPFLMTAVLWIKGLTPPFWQYGLRVADFAHVRQFGEFGFFAAVSSTALTALSRRAGLPAFLLAFAAVFGIVLTGCRGALLSWILFVVLLCFFSPARLRIAVHGFAVLALSAGLVWYLDHSGLLPSPNIFNRVAQLAQGEGPGFDSGRIPLWMSSLKQIAAHPLFGSGPEGYWLSGCCDRTIMQAHDFILQFLMEFGAVGCSILALIVIRTIKHLGGGAALLKRAGATPGNRILSCLMVAYLAYSLIDQTMYHLVPLLHMALFSGLLAAGLAQARITVAST
ncbi:MAG: O-antigen ligase family protein [Pseudomonadota bacterium]